MADPISNLDKPLWNVLVIIIVANLLEIVWVKSGVLDNAGMSALMLNSLPLIIGIGTIIFYLLSRLITKNRNWILSLIGIGMNLLLVLRAFI